MRASQTVHRFLWTAVLGCICFMLASRAVAGEAELPRQVKINGVEFVLISEGEFWYTVTTGNLGLQPANAPLFRHVRVWLDSFYMARYEARASDLVRFLNTDPLAPALRRELEQSTLEATPDRESPPDTDCTVRRDADGVFQVIHPERDLPATYLSWNLANAFALWMGFRLPTEAEWEKAARGPAPDRRRWPWGGEYVDDTFANFSQSGKCVPDPVTAYPKGRSPYGIYNMAGNVEEYVADWYNTAFDKRLKDGVRNPELAGESLEDFGEGPLKLAKGGRWSAGLPEMLIAQRNFMLPGSGLTRNGVRFALDVSRVRQHVANGTATVMDDQ